jgi:hypothetical protein
MEIKVQMPGGTLPEGYTFRTRAELGASDTEMRRYGPEMEFAHERALEEPKLEAKIASALSLKSTRRLRRVQRRAGSAS